MAKVVIIALLKILPNFLRDAAQIGTWPAERSKGRLRYQGEKHWQRTNTEEFADPKVQAQA